MCGTLSVLCIACVYVMLLLFIRDVYVWCYILVASVWCFARDVYVCDVLSNVCTVWCVLLLLFVHDVYVRVVLCSVRDVCVCDVFIRAV